MGSLRVVDEEAGNEISGDFGFGGLKLDGVEGDGAAAGADAKAGGGGE